MNVYVNTCIREYMYIWIHVCVYTCVLINKYDDNIIKFFTQLLGNSQKEYERIIVTFSIKNQLRYRGNLVRHILRAEKRYYERIVAYSKDHLMLFPYHLADMICKGLRTTPFSYYISIVEKLMQAEKSYDTLPNFTAADCNFFLLFSFYGVLNLFQWRILRFTTVEYWKEWIHWTYE